MEDLSVFSLRDRGKFWLQGPKYKLIPPLDQPSATTTDRVKSRSRHSSCWDGDLASRLGSLQGRQSPSGPSRQRGREQLQMTSFHLRPGFKEVSEMGSVSRLVEEGLIGKRTGSRSFAGVTSAGLTPSPATQSHVKSRAGDPSA